MKRIAGFAGAVALAVLAGTMMIGPMDSAAAQDAPPRAAAARPAGPPPLGAGPWDYSTASGPIHVEVVTTGLVSPWGMAFLPDGGMLITERPGRLRIVAADGTLDPEPVTGLPPVFAVGIAGMTDIALHPDFANNRLIYISYSKPTPANAEEQAQAVLRARWDGGHELTQVEDIFVATPWYGAASVPERCCGQGPAFGSFGGRILFDADGYLFITSGDRNYGEMVQKTDNHFGKILRLNADGSVPAGNPWVGREGHVPEAWSTGHRNPLGLTINPLTGEMWESEFGPRGGDEVNRIVRGGNYGWITVTQGFHYNGAQAERLRLAPGMIDPVLVYGPPSLNPGNLAFYTGDKLPGWHGDLLLASFTHGLLRYNTDALGVPQGEPEELLRDLGQRWRDVRVGPDGNVYLLTDMAQGAVLRITPGS
jgi:glucose/arabinose dehydrogenase